MANVMIASRTFLLLLAGSIAALPAAADPLADLREVLHRYPAKAPFAAGVGALSEGGKRQERTVEVRRLWRSPLRLAQ